MTNRYLEKFAAEQRFGLALERLGSTRSASGASLRSRATQTSVAWRRVGGIPRPSQCGFWSRTCSSPAGGIAQSASMSCDGDSRCAPGTSRFEALALLRWSAASAHPRRTLIFRRWTQLSASQDPAAPQPPAVSATSITSAARLQLQLRRSILQPSFLIRRYARRHNSRDVRRF
jgi:hypothetical protein